MAAKRLLGLFEKLGRGVAVIAMLVLTTASLVTSGSQNGCSATDAAATVTYQYR